MTLKKKENKEEKGVLKQKDGNHKKKPKQLAHLNLIKCRGITHLFSDH